MKIELTAKTNWSRDSLYQITQDGFQVINQNDSPTSCFVVLSAKGKYVLLTEWFPSGYELMKPSETVPHFKFYGFSDLDNQYTGNLMYRMEVSTSKTYDWKQVRTIKDYYECLIYPSISKKIPQDGQVVFDVKPTAGTSDKLIVTVKNGRVVSEGLASASN